MKDKEIYQPHLLAVIAGLVFAISVFFYLCYANPQYDGGYYNNPTAMGFDAAIFPGSFAFVFLATFLCEHFLKGDVRTNVGYVCAGLDGVLAVGAIARYFNENPDLAQGLLLPRIVAALLILLLPIGSLVLLYERKTKGSFFGTENPWRELPLVSAFLLLGALALSLIDVSVIVRYDGTSLPALCFTYLALAGALFGLLYAGFLSSKSECEPSDLVSRLLVIGVVEAILPLLPLFINLSSYLDGAISYQLFYYSLFMHAGMAVFGLAQMIYYLYRRSDLSL